MLAFVPPSQLDGLGEIPLKLVMNRGTPISGKLHIGRNVQLFDDTCGEKLFDLSYFKDETLFTSDIPVRSSPDLTKPLAPFPMSVRKKGGATRRDRWDQGVLRP